MKRLKETERERKKEEREMESLRERERLVMGLWYIPLITRPWKRTESGAREGETERERERHV